MKINYSPLTPSQNIRKGFASVLLVVSSGLALMLMLLFMYEDTANSQDAQKMNMLSGDYQQREDAFLRALVNIVPNHAMRTMRDDSLNTPDETKWSTALSLALSRANAEQAIPTNIATSLSVDTMRVANTANTSTNSIDKSQIIFPISDTHITKEGSDTFVSCGIKKYNKNLSKHYPPRLRENADKSYKIRSTYYPLISNSRIYDNKATAWTGGRTTDKRFALLPLPKNHFRYKGGDTFIARHNWWTFEVNFAEQEKDATKLNTRKKQYLFSIYEVPAQLAINAGSHVILGKHEGAGSWNSNLEVEGGVFASRVKTENTFTSPSIASRKQIELSSSTVIGSSFTGSDLAGNAPENYETKAKDLLITSAGDSGRIAFIPINGGEFITEKGAYTDLDEAKDATFYNNPDLTTATPDPDSNEPGKNSISPTSWKYYSRGACQCKMRLVFNDAKLKFSFEDDSITDADFTDHADYPKIITRISDGISINVKALLDLLEKSPTITPDISNSLYIKGPTGSKVILEHAEDLTLATAGFSIVCNSTLVIASDLNIKPITPNKYPPLSVFAPRIQYGKQDFSYDINVTGSLTSTAKTGVSHIADLESGDGNVTGNKISGTLQSITNPEKLPPINMMNWMIIVREIH